MSKEHPRTPCTPLFWRRVFAFPIMTCDKSRRWYSLYNSEAPRRITRKYSISSLQSSISPSRCRMQDMDPICLSCRGEPRIGQSSTDFPPLNWVNVPSPGICQVIDQSPFVSNLPPWITAKSMRSRQALRVKTTTLTDNVTVRY